MLYLLLIAIAAAPIDISRAANESVDLIELNHFHDECGHAIYDQVIFYEWSRSRLKYHVRAWCLVEPKDFPARVPFESHYDNRYRVRWYDNDQSLFREIKSDLFRETWTQEDPERSNKRIHDEKLRTGLIQASEYFDPPKVCPVE